MIEPQPQQIRRPPPPAPPAPPGMAEPPPGPWGFGPPPPPRKSHKVWVVVGIVAGVLVGGLILIGIIGAAVDASKATKAPAYHQPQFQHPEDVTITRCRPDEFGFAAATVIITNHSGKPSIYAVTVTFDAKATGEQIGNGYAGADHLQPGQATTPQDVTTGVTPPPGGFTCRIGDATRYAAN
jgi:hypothetical protein